MRLPKHGSVTQGRLQRLIADIIQVAGVEKRVNITSSLIDQLKNLKVLGLESYVSAIMQRLRVEEVYLSRPVKAIFIWCQAFCESTRYCIALC